MKLVSWNVNGIRAIEKKGFHESLKELNPDVLALQEIKAEVGQLEESLTNIDGYTSYWHSAVKKGYSGVSLYCRNKPINVYYGLGNKEFDCEGRVIVAEYEKFYLINCYFPNAQEKIKRINYRLGFGSALLEYIQQLDQSKAIIICGDYNVAHNEIDLANPKANVGKPGFSNEERGWFNEFLSTGFVDTFRAFYPSKPDEYSWWSYRTNARARNVGWRIDYFCIDKNSLNMVKDAIIYNKFLGSDHCPVAIQL